jgi:anti-sigma B factor antagonist
MSQDAAPLIHYKTTAFVTVVGFTTPYLQSEESIEKAGAELFELVELKGLTTLVISFTGVRFVSSSMLAQIVKLHKKLAKVKGRLRICCLTPALQEVLRTSQLDKMLEVFPDEAAALTKI